MFSNIFFIYLFILFHLFILENCNSVQPVSTPTKKWPASTGESCVLLFSWNIRLARGGQIISDVIYENRAWGQMCSFD